MRRLDGANKSICGGTTMESTLCLFCARLIVQSEPCEPTKEENWEAHWMISVQVTMRRRLHSHQFLLTKRTDDGGRMQDGLVKIGSERSRHVKDNKSLHIVNMHLSYGRTCNLRR